MEQNSPAARSLVLSYLGLRKAIGIIGFFLPFILAFGKLVTDGPGIESSISTYYYSGMRDVFVGAMCAIGIFLFSYRGYDKKDDMAGKLASVFAIGLALVPTAPDFSHIPHERLIGTIHLVLSSSFFLMLGISACFGSLKPIQTKRPRDKNCKETRCTKYVAP